ncbi:universal stress protein [Promicromonospora thailandica]|uniref:Universal stress protein family protein n=1 Tax=Promicromonospora thailandica TaxID=765201 RepID=A0A9X2JVS6_9MICO|nr:universal stress protein [Promicromonospora thailandica]MCP2265890.1 Universal stress protein family protein [Promicromonospora thailandica]BFF21541.1 universal stress protein [Promicromonospora thailandica]
MTIVVGHLATPEGQEALRTAVTEARERAVPLVVVTSGKRPLDECRSETEELVGRLGAGVDLRVEEGTGDLAEDLIRAAASVGAGLIVIGLRRRSPVGKLILGAGAQRILVEAPCPVLAVKVGSEA